MTTTPHEARGSDAGPEPLGEDLPARAPSARAEAELSDRALVGRAIYARNFEVDEAEASRLMSDRVGALYTQEVFEVAGGQGWQSAALTDRDRSIAIIAAMVSQNVVDQRLTTYLSLARRNGLTQQSLSALMVLLTAYVGQPYASAAMAVVHSQELEPIASAD